MAKLTHNAFLSEDVNTQTIVKSEGKFLLIDNEIDFPIRLCFATKDDIINLAMILSNMAVAMEGADHV